MLLVRNLSCGYGSLRVVKGVSFHVNDGEIVCLLGANGAGKSTTMRAITGLLSPWSGEIRVDGREIAGRPAWEGVANAMVLVPEGRQLFGDMTVMENLIVGGYRNPDRDRAIEEVMVRFPRLKERAHQLAGTLSGGEQQMLAIGRALVARPRLLLLDEPSMGLAPLLVRTVFEVIRGLRDQGVTVFLVEQNAIAALSISDRGYVLETGEIILEGDSADLLHNPEVKRAYLGKGYKEVWE
ncbi:MAG: ABC transporter ATP-binding protein [Kiritimatiellae bacterium]|nr:ABC transporter ATP-binding protein [Kiritimatiellia bacterium]